MSLLIDSIGDGDRSQRISVQRFTNIRETLHLDLLFLLQICWTLEQSSSQNDCAF